MKHKRKIYNRPWLEQNHKADYSFQSHVRESGVTRVRISGVRKKSGHQMATPTFYLLNTISESNRWREKVENNTLSSKQVLINSWSQL